VYRTYANEFVSKLKPSNTLIPASLDEVFAKQTKPSQKLASKQREPYQTSKIAKKSWSYFQKVESYDNVNNPRPIANPNTALKEEYSKYTYPIFDYVSKLPFFAFGKTPKEIAARVRAVCNTADEILPTDFSRWDGRHSKFLANFEKKLLNAFYDQRHHDHIKACWSNHYENKGYTKHGVKVEMGWGRPSGSPDTALFNTLDNAFLAYCAYRNNGLTPDQAYESLGVYGGDDGLSTKITPKEFHVVCKDFGVKFTGDIQLTAQPLIFLGRLYVQPRNFLHSVAEPIRCLSKIHMISCNKTKSRGLADKIAGYLVTDPTAPILSDYLKNLLKKHCDNKVGTASSYWAIQAENCPFPLDAPQDVVMSAVIANLKITSSEALSLLQALSEGGIPPLPARPVEVKVKAVVGDRLVTKTD